GRKRRPEHSDDSASRPGASRRRTLSGRQGQAARGERRACTDVVAAHQGRRREGRRASLCRNRVGGAVAFRAARRRRGRGGGFRVAEIVGKYERLSGAPRRTCASPAYERGFGFSLDAHVLADENLARRFERRVRQARRSYDHLMDHIPESARDALFTVCVEDREINSLLHKDLQAVLRQLAVSFGFASAPRVRRARGAGRRPADAGPLAEALIEKLACWFAGNGAAGGSFKLDTAHPDLRGLTAFGRDRAGSDISHAVVAARGDFAAAELDDAIVKAALARGWRERRARGLAVAP